MDGLESMTKTEEITRRLENANVPFRANDNIAEFLEPGDLDAIRGEVEAKINELLRCLVIDVDNDPNTQGTAERIARMYINEVFNGRYTKCPRITEFPNTKALDDMIVVGNINVRSTCSHHLAPISGKAWVGVVPGKKIIGISKFSRLINWIASRPQIQEECAVQIADELERRINPQGVAVVIKASHTCMTWRGVKETDSVMTTSIMRGLFRENHALRAEFLEMVK